MNKDCLTRKYQAMLYAAGLPRADTCTLQNDFSDAYKHARGITAQTGVDIESTMLVVLADFVNAEAVTAANEMKKMADDIPLFNGALPLLFNPLVT